MKMCLHPMQRTRSTRNMSQIRHSGAQRLDDLKLTIEKFSKTTKLSNLAIITIYPPIGKPVRFQKLWLIRLKYQFEISQIEIQFNSKYFLNFSIFSFLHLHRTRTESVQQTRSFSTSSWLCKSSAMLFQRY